ncbi:hypothetical protein [Aureimonas sp. D3]|uniref:hypothetical protein n=1 Tax=Aureimonas sp. D3 TaxID=1638164 RepID=UPI000AA61871|nr:hypothetical protein [Aureimonas sp. D3]
MPKAKRALLIAAFAWMTLAKGSIAYAGDTAAVILREDQYPELVQFCDRPAIPYHATWPIGPRDVSALEARLIEQPDLIEDPDFRGSDANLQKWHRQYGGILFRGRRAIFAKYYLKSDGFFSGQDRLTEPLIICDSDSGWLWFLYDVEKRAMIDPNPPTCPVRFMRGEMRIPCSQLQPDPSRFGDE